MFLYILYFLNYYVEKKYLKEILKRRKYLYRSNDLFFINPINYKNNT